MMRKRIEIVEGVGHIRFSGHEGPARYAIEGEPARLRLGQGRLKGSFGVDVETASDAFRAGVGVLTLEGGREYRVTMVGHSTGGDEVFVELRV